MIVREAGGVVVDPTTGGEVDFLARCVINKYVETRSLEALRAPTSIWRPFGLENVAFF